MSGHLMKITLAMNVILAVCWYFSKSSTGDRKRIHPPAAAGVAEPMPAQPPKPPSLDTLQKPAKQITPDVPQDFISVPANMAPAWLVIDDGLFHLKEKFVEAFGLDEAAVAHVNQSLTALIAALQSDERKRYKVEESDKGEYVKIPAAAAAVDSAFQEFRMTIAAVLSPEGRELLCGVIQNHQHIELARHDLEIYMFKEGDISHFVIESYDGDKFLGKYSRPYTVRQKLSPPIARRFAHVIDFRRTLLGDENENDVDK